MKDGSVSYPEYRPRSESCFSLEAKNASTLIKDKTNIIAQGNAASKLISKIVELSYLFRHVRISIFRDSRK